MSLRVIGAGMGRTGTASLRQALESLLGTRCYHMTELLANPSHVDFWYHAVFSGRPDWQAMFSAYGAGVDFPISSFWRELSQVYPDALILLSKRPAAEWWESASKTIFAPHQREEGPLAELSAELSRRAFPIQAVIHDKEASMKMYEEWNNAVLRDAPTDRLIVWEVGDGWGPLCDALGLPIPSMPFPHENSKQEFINRYQSIS